MFVRVENEIENVVGKALVNKHTMSDSSDHIQASNYLENMDFQIKEINFQITINEFINDKQNVPVYILHW